MCPAKELKRGGPGENFFPPEEKGQEAQKWGNLMTQWLLAKLCS